MIEEHFFIDMGFADGKFSGGEPLKPWNKGYEGESPVNLAIEDGLERPIFSTRYVREGATPTREKRPPAQGNAAEQQEAPAPESIAEAGMAEGSEEDTAPQLPQKKPNYRLPSRPVYASGKRRSTRFSG